MLASKLSNLSLQLYGLFLKNRVCKGQASEHEKVTKYFNDRLPVYTTFLKLGFREKLWLYKSYLWFSFLIQDFLACYKYSKKWVNLFHEYPGMIKPQSCFFSEWKSELIRSVVFCKTTRQVQRGTHQV